MTEKMISRRDGAIGHVIFNQPEKQNAVSLEMWEAAERILADFEADPHIRVVVLSGAGGKSFVSGADISEFEKSRGTAEAQQHYNSRTRAVYQRVERFPKPTIAMIHGYCIGGGLNLACCCDLRVCSDRGSFGMPAAASRACERVSATTKAMPSPVKRALPSASMGRSAWKAGWPLVIGRVTPQGRRAGPPAALRSSSVQTPSTPGAARAAAVSIPRIAPGIGARSRTAWVSPAGFRSST